MTATVAQIWRYPIKSIGSEPLENVTLTAGQTLPWDRTWAVAHEAARIEGNGWARCSNFMRVAKAPKLAAVRAKLDPDSEQITLSHPDQPSLTLQPDAEAEALKDWLAPLVPQDRAQPARVFRPKGRGMTDSAEPTLSLNNLTSHRAVGQKLGRDLDVLRWRGNLWIDGLGPWEEFEWIDRRVQIGGAVLEVIGRIDRCTATMANPDTGQRDADTLAALKDGWGHQDFGVHAIVVESGTVTVGDPVRVVA